MSLKLNQVLISIHYVPYLGRIQGSVKSSQNNVIVNYLCTVKVHRCVVGACRLHGDVHCIADLLALSASTAALHAAREATAKEFA